MSWNKWDVSVAKYAYGLIWQSVFDPWTTQDKITKP